MENLKTVGLKIVMKNIWSLINPVCKDMSQVCKILFKQIVPEFKQSFPIYLKVILQTEDIVWWNFLDSHLQYGYYIQAVIVFQ